MVDENIGTMLCWECGSERIEVVRGKLTTVIRCLACGYEFRVSTDAYDRFIREVTFE